MQDFKSINGQTPTQELIDKAFNKFPWLSEGKFANAEIVITEPALIWFSGTWLDGNWDDGDWRGGLWCNGVWLDGVCYNMKWVAGTWNTGQWKSGTWIDGRWHDGYWNDGMWMNGIWDDGIWINGTWKDGFWLNGDWSAGIWIKGTWFGGNWIDGIWLRGKSRIGYNLWSDDKPSSDEYQHEDEDDDKPCSDDKDNTCKDCNNLSSNLKSYKGCMLRDLKGIGAVILDIDELRGQGLESISINIDVDDFSDDEENAIQIIKRSKV